MSHRFNQVYRHRYVGEGKVELSDLSADFVLLHLTLF
jgi:hypothetical protein